MTSDFNFNVVYNMNDNKNNTYTLYARLTISSNVIFIPFQFLQENL